jgi:hypothetical protein
MRMLYSEFISHWNAVHKSGLSNAQSREMGDSHFIAIWSHGKNLIDDAVCIIPSLCWSRTFSAVMWPRSDFISCSGYRADRKRHCNTVNYRVENPRFSLSGRPNQCSTRSRFFRDIHSIRPSLTWESSVRSLDIWAKPDLLTSVWRYLSLSGRPMGSLYVISLNAWYTSVNQKQPA